MSLLLTSALLLATTSVHVDADGLALEGHDPVAFHTVGTAIPGDPALTAVHDGATYRFSSPANRALFAARPERYAPAYGGWCAYGVAKGKLYPVDLSTAVVVDGRLYLNYDVGARRKFDADRRGMIARADGNWPALAREAAGR